MDWMKFFKAEKTSTAKTAKERLLIAVAHQRRGDQNGPTYLPQMREELLAVVRKYVQIPDDAVEVKVQREDGIEVLELAITLPDHAG
jgi:cell division topological specificity factor